MNEKITIMLEIATGETTAAFSAQLRAKQREC